MKITTVIKTVYDTETGEIVEYQESVTEPRKPTKLKYVMTALGGTFVKDEDGDNNA